MNNRGPKARIGLALGGGGARGWAHIGVLRAAAEHGIQINAYAGTSIGSLVGGFAAAGKLRELEDVLSEMDLKRIIQLFAERKLPRSGLVDGRHIVELIRKHIGYPGIENLPASFAAVATDAESGEEVILDQGDLVMAIRASIAIPGIFSPVTRQGRYLVDGGLVNPLPVSVLARGGFDTIVAVNLHGDGMTPFTGAEQTPPGTKRRRRTSTPSKSSTHWLERQKVKLEDSARDAMKRWTGDAAGPNIFQVMANTVDIVSSRLTKVRLNESPPDLLIEPKVGKIGHLEFHRVNEAIAAGYEAASKAFDGWRA